jgi:hypothetical protein
MWKVWLELDKKQTHDTINVLTCEFEYLYKFCIGETTYFSSIFKMENINRENCFNNTFKSISTVSLFYNFGIPL